jgi:hypothetical protein
MSSRDEIRSAMERLLSGTSQYTDGRLTRTNLALEAGVGRATLYRQPDLVAEWIRRGAESDVTEIPLSAQATVARLTRQLGEERQRRAELERVAQGLALVVAELYRQLEGRDGDSAANRVVGITTRLRQLPR